MPHPEDLPPAGQRPDNRSELMKAQANAKKGEKVNFCMKVHREAGWGEGCPDERLDEYGYCRHLVGFTVDQKRYEPMVKDERGRRVVRVKTRVVGHEIEEEEIEQKDEKTGNVIGYKIVKREVPITKPLLEKVLATDKLVQITSSYRVYRARPETLVYTGEHEKKRLELQKKIDKLEAEKDELPNDMALIG